MQFLRLSTSALAHNWAQPEANEAFWLLAPVSSHHMVFSDADMQVYTSIVKGQRMTNYGGISNPILLI